MIHRVKSVGLPTCMRSPSSGQLWVGVSRLLKFWVDLAIAVIFNLSESLPAMQFGIINIYVCLSVKMYTYLNDMAQ